jgi:hypothetical protein
VAVQEGNPLGWLKKETGFRTAMMMKPVLYMAVSVMVLAFAGSSTLAVAQTKTVRPQSSIENIAGLTPLVQPAGESFIRDDVSGFSKPQSKVYQFNLDGKWGVKFDVNQPESSAPRANDIDAGAFYKLTPSLRVGGTLGFGEKSDPMKPEPARSAAQGDSKQPRVRLETTFKF